MKLERVLGLTVSSNASLATAPSTGEEYSWETSYFARVGFRGIVFFILLEVALDDSVIGEKSQRHCRSGGFSFSIRKQAKQVN